MATAALASPRRRPHVWAALACLALAGWSVAALPSLPAYDPFAWIVWGNEIAHHGLLAPHEPLILRAGPSWKPLPVLLTSVLALLGSPVTLWMILARAGGLFGVWLAYRLGTRLGEDRRWPAAGPLAGLLSALAVVLLAQWVHFMYRGTSEPLTVTAALLAVERHLAGRRGAAFAAGLALALMRPEAALFLGLYGVWLLWRGPGVARRVAVVAGLLVVPAAWIVPPWIAIGQPLQASSQARDFHGNAGHDLLALFLHRATHVTLLPVLLAAIAAIAIGVVRREPRAAGLGGLALAYGVVIGVMTLRGYPGLTRFVLPAGAIACVLAGVGVARLAALARGGVASPLIALALVAVAAPAFVTRVDYARGANRSAAEAVRSYHAIVTAVRRAGSTPTVLPCATSHAAVNHTAQTSLAWALGVPLTRVEGVTHADASMRHPALAFFAPRNPVVGGSPRRLLDGLRARLVTREAMWRVLRVTRTHDPVVDRCVGDRALVIIRRDHRALRVRHDRRSPRARARRRREGPALRRRLRRARLRRRHRPSRLVRQDSELSASARAGRRRRPHASPGRARPSRPPAGERRE